jgi:3-oxoadipate enol-lactonase
MPFVRRPGKPGLHYTVDDFTDPWKDAPYLILQHGFGRSGRFWYNWVPHLAGRFKVVRPDLRGLGQSTENFDPEDRFTIGDYVADVAAIIADLGGPVHYCGESFGGLLGLELTARRPELVKSLTLVATPMRISPEAQKMMSLGYPTWEEALRTLGAKGWSEAMNGELRFPPDADRAMIAWFAAEMAKNATANLIAMSRAVPTADGDACLPEIKVPALGLYPKQGRSNDAALMATLKTGIPQIEIVEIACEYHAIQMLEPELLAGKVAAFVGGLESAAKAS